MGSAVWLPGPHGLAPWACLLGCLAGRELGLRARPPALTLRAHAPRCASSPQGDSGTDSFRCVEMREGRPWVWQADAYGVAATVHCLLYGRYMEVERVQEQATGGLGAWAGWAGQVGQGLHLDGWAAWGGATVGVKAASGRSREAVAGSTAPSALPLWRLQALCLCGCASRLSATGRPSCGDPSSPCC